MRFLCVLACVTFGCASPDLELAAEEQAMWNGDGEDPDGEVIEVEGEAPFDPNWEGPDQGAPGNQGEQSGGAGGAGGGNGSGGADEAGGGPKPKPRPIPEPKDCSELVGEECAGCCWYNHNFVDGEVCRRKRGRAKKALCWKDWAIPRYANCLRQCPPDPGILTIGVTP
jgi:hypothetical protein